MLKVSKVWREITQVAQHGKILQKSVFCRIKKTGKWKISTNETHKIWAELLQVEATMMWCIHEPTFWGFSTSPFFHQMRNLDKPCALVLELSTVTTMAYVAVPGAWAILGKEDHIKIWVENIREENFLWSNSGSSNMTIIWNTQPRW